MRFLTQSRMKISSFSQFPKSKLKTFLDDEAYRQGWLGLDLKWHMTHLFVILPEASTYWCWCDCCCAHCSCPSSGHSTPPIPPHTHTPSNPFLSLCIYHLFATAFSLHLKLTDQGRQSPHTASFLIFSLPPLTSTHVGIGCFSIMY